MKILLVKDDSKNYVDDFHRFMIQSTKIIKNNQTPFIVYVYSDTLYYHYLKDEIDDWFKSLNTSYTIRPIKKDDVWSGWNIIIPKKKIAILFKLTWM